MKKKIQNNKFSEEYLIKKYLTKLNFNKTGTFNFENDAAYVNIKKNGKLVITSDSISENIDFFKNDDPRSIAKKITTINLSDLSAMGSNPYAYSLNLFLPNYIDDSWLNEFSNELLKIQKRFNFYLIGGDLSKSNQLHISSTFFGKPHYGKVISQNKISLANDIWVTGNLCDSYTGLQILKKKFHIKNKNIRNYFMKKYFYPEPCMIGPKIYKYALSMKDISDGFVGDLKKMLNNNFGAKIYIDKLPVSRNLQKMINLNLINKKNLLNNGDNYNLIAVTSKKNRDKVYRLAKNKNFKITLVGKVIKKLKIVNDSDIILNIPKEFDHFR